MPAVRFAARYVLGPPCPVHGCHHCAEALAIVPESIRMVEALFEAGVSPLGVLIEIEQDRHDARQAFGPLE